MPSRILRDQWVAQGAGVAVIHRVLKADRVRDKIWKKGIHQDRWVAPERVVRGKAKV